MSALAYHEPYKLPAGLLAIAVHGAFFALLFFGFSWQTQPAATMSVELWDSIPRPSAAAPPKPEIEAPKPPPEKEVLPPELEAKPQPDIVLPDKKAKEKPRPAAPKPDTSILERQYALEQAARAERAAATGRVVDEYTGKIAAKIRSRIVMPPGVPDDARAEFKVTLLPGGRVLNVRLEQSSGYAAYDDAVERAIIKAEPLPLPPDPVLFGRFRELKLGFRPKEQE